MKIVTDQISHHSTPVNDLEVNSIEKPNSMTDIDQLKGGLKIFPEDCSNLVCNKKDTERLQLDMKDSAMLLPGDGYFIVKESQTEVGFDDPREMRSTAIRSDTDNGVESSVDVSVIEPEHLVSQECSRETDGSAVRDICVDEGVPANDKILVDDIADGHRRIVEDSNAAKDTKYGADNVKVEVDWPVLVGLKPTTDKESEKDFISCESKVHTHQNEFESGTIGLVSSDLQKDKVVDTLIGEDINAEVQSKTFVEYRFNDKQNILHQDSVAEFEDATDKLICPSSTSEATIKETADEGTVETSKMKIDAGQEARNNPSVLAVVNKNEVELPSSAFHPHMTYTYQIPEQQSLASDHLAASARIQRDHFDSSFASVGHYTNSIAYSGSLSHRSDASTVSTRSFAFPVLQNEWNFSPVRMRKADRRHLGRRRGWMNGLFCCKF